MKARKVLAAVAAAACATVGGAADASAQRGAPVVERMVAFPGGRVDVDRVRAVRTKVRVGRRKTCAVPAATPMAALALRRRTRVRFVDYGSCSRRPADASGLFVKALGRFVNRGLDGWVYKVNGRLGTAGAADPTGPFGDGRLRRRDRVVWFYCVYAERSCQRSLDLEAEVEDGELRVAVDAYDDDGEGVDAARAKVVVRNRRGREVAREVTDAEGRVSFALQPGRHTVHARKRGTIRSFEEVVRVR
jgi:hypothetical protein